ncbi:hypothetical protein AWENTII_007553 [Aspergillus wentii]
MAMGQEQRAIHPFFRKESGISTKSSPIIQIDNSPNGQSREPDDAYLTCENSLTDTPSVMLEHDPNSSRRKRQRTKEPRDNETSQGPQVNDGDISRTPSPHGVKDAPVDASTMSTHAPEAGIESQTPSTNTLASHPVTPALPPPDYPELPSDTTQSIGLPERRSARQKTIGLNSNGKLLSSPATNRSEDKLDEKPGSKRNRNGSRKTKKNEKKMVVIKYATENDARERIGSVIEDIVNGRKKYVPPTRPAQRPAPKRVQSQPSKATHPFFMKKSNRPAETPSSTEQVSHDSESKDTQNTAPGKTNPKPTSDFAKSFYSFKPRPKFPEPIHPIWPPQDLVHVRGSQESPIQRQLGPLNLDQKKAKMAAVSINDKENVLLSDMHRARHSESQSPNALRVPKRHNASGKTLLKKVMRQLAGSDAEHDADRKVPNKSCHPAVSKLQSSIPTSMTAFDRGEYDTSLWAQKYAPKCASEILQSGRETLMLRDWLKYLMVSAVDTGKSSDTAKQKAEDKKRAKKRKRAEKLDGFIVSSEEENSEMDELVDSDEDELAGDVTVSKRTVIRSGDMAISSRKGGEKGRMSNAILLSGPSGCGKTASVYAVAKELDFEVFEIHPGNRRSAKDIVERVGDMTRNHLVHNLNGSDETEVEDAKQNKLTFFKSSSAKNTKGNEKSRQKNPEHEADQKRSRSQKQSLILLEEADLLFEEDKQFWSGVITLIQQSKRPIIITCNDESLIPIEDISLHAILRYRNPTPDLAVEYLLLMAANEGHLLNRGPVCDLYAANGKDLRKSIMELNFWCQMAVGSEKSGIDWIIDRWPPGSDLDSQGDPLRVISKNTYQSFMGWFNRDMMLSNTLDSQAECQQESLHWWKLTLQDSESMCEFERPSPASAHEQLERLRFESEYADMRSSLDLLSSGCSVESELDAIDISVPPMPEKQRTNYIEGYPLLHTDLKPDYSSLPAAIGSTFKVLMGNVFRPNNEHVLEYTQAEQVMHNVIKPQAVNPPGAELLAALDPVKQGPYNVFPVPTGRLAPSFENGTRPLSEDLAPYIRAIMGFDLRLEKYRLELSGLLSHSTNRTKKMRTTKASRAALEGGTKTDTRKERWFPSDTYSSRIMATGNKEWQDLLVEQGHFCVGTGPEASREPSRDCNEDASESSGDGGI